MATSATKPYRHDRREGGGLASAASRMRVAAAADLARTRAGSRSSTRAVLTGCRRSWRWARLPLLPRRPDASTSSRYGPSASGVVLQVWAR